MTLQRFRLDGRLAVVTGAGKGLGRGCALTLAEAGADVALLARSEGDLAEVAAEVERLGRKAYPVAVDVCDSAAVRRCFAALPRLDVLVNNAGGNVPQPFLEVTEEAFDQVMTLNVRAAFFAAQAAARIMVAAGGGSIVNMSSQAGHVALRHRTVYCATKFAVEGMTKTMAMDLASQGVRVNAVAPTFVETPLTRPFLAKPEFRAYVDANLLLPHLASIDDVAAAVLYLASDASASTTGTSLLVDGGWTAH